MARARRGLAVAAVLAALATAGCGGSGSNSGAARAAAAKGCGQFLQLGGSLRTAPKTQAFDGSSIDKQFTAAQAQFDRAAKLDKHTWGQTDQAARQFIADLRSGQTPDNTVIDYLTNGFETFASPSTTSTTG